MVDEYDVFLDQPSRKVTLKEIQKYALSEEQHGRQFIVVTPNDLKGMIEKRDTQVKRMPNPDRQHAGSAHALVQLTLDETLNRNIVG